MSPGPPAASRAPANSQPLLPAMDSRITPTKTNSGPRRAAFVLSEVIVATGITALLMVGLVAFFMFAGESFAAMFNYADLDGANRIAMDTLTTDLRQCNKVKIYTTTSLTLEDYDLSILTYTYDPAAKTLVRGHTCRSRWKGRNPPR